MINNGFLLVNMLVLNSNDENLRVSFVKKNRYNYNHYVDESRIALSNVYGIKFIRKFLKFRKM